MNIKELSRALDEFTLPDDMPLDVRGGLEENLYEAQESIKLVCKEVTEWENLKEIAELHSGLTDRREYDLWQEGAHG